MPTLVLTIEGTARPIKDQSLSISESTRGRNILNVEVVSEDGTYRPAIGDELILTEDGTTIFGGTVQGVIERGIVSGFKPGIINAIAAVDFKELPSRRVSTGSVVTGTTVRNALDQFISLLTGYGVSLDAMAMPATLPDLRWEEYTRLDQIFDQIVEAASASGTQYIWEIDYTKSLKAYPLGTNAAPFNVTDATESTVTVGDIQVEPSREDYYNRVLVRYMWHGGKAYAFLGNENATFTNFADTEAVTIGGRTYTFQNTLTDVSGNVKIGADGHESLNNLAAAITLGGGAGTAYAASTTEHSEVTAIMYPWVLKAVARSIGTGGNSIGVSTTTVGGARWYGEGGGSLTTLHLGIDDSLSGLVDADDAGEQAAYGIHETIFDLTTVFDETAAQAFADAALARGVNARAGKVTYTTRQTDIRPGDSQTITIAKRNLNATYYVTDVHTTNPGANVLFRRVTAVTGNAAGNSWQDTIAQWSGGGSAGLSVSAVINLSGGGGSVGSGTVGTLPKWATSASLTDSLISESGSAVTVAGTLAVTGLASLNGGIAVDTNKFTVADVTGDTVIAGTLGVTGQSTFTGQANIVTHLRPTINWTSDIGSQTLKVRTLYAAELEVDTLVAQAVIATIGGEILTIPTTTVTQFLPAANTSIQVEHNELVAGDRIWLEARGQFEMMAIVSGPTGTGPYSYVVTRNLDGSGANDWLAGDAVANTGTTGDGYIHQYARTGRFGGTGPTIVGQVRTGTTYSDIAPRWALGNLNGLYGYVADTYGVAIGNVAAANILIDDTNGIRIRSGTTTKIQFTTAGVATIGGWVINGSVGIDNGANLAIHTAYSFFTGGYAGRPAMVVSDGGSNLSALIGGSASSDVCLFVGGTDPGTAPFRVTLAGAVTATSATITGSITASTLTANTAGTIGGWTIGASTLTGGNATLASSGNLTLGTVNDVIRLSADDVTYRAWIGNATAASAPFRISKSGEAWATNAHLTGEIDANSGTIGALTVDGTLTIGSGGSIAAGGNVTIDNANGIQVTSGSNFVKLGSSFTYPFEVGNTGLSSYFRVGFDGIISFSGSISATGATANIRGLTIDNGGSNFLYLLHLAGSGTRTLQVDNDGLVSAV